MIRLRHKMMIRATRLMDQAILIATALGVIYYRPGVASLAARQPVPTPDRFSDTLAMLILAVGWVGIFDFCIRYRADRFVSLRMHLKDLVKASTLSAFWFLIITTSFAVRSVHVTEVVTFWLIVTCAGLMTRVAWKAFLVNARKSGYNYRYLLMVGANPRSAEFAQKIAQRPELGFKLVGFVAESEESRRIWQENETPGPVIGLVEDIRGILERERVDELMVCVSVESKFSTVTNIIEHARDLGIVLRIVPEAGEGSVLKNVHIEEFENEFVITFFREQLLLQLFAKRLVDIGVSAAALLALSPLMAAVALMIKFTSPGPILFAQDRVGMNQRRFRLYKFRSMVKDADQRKKDLAHLNELDGPAFKINNDPRITSVGRFIRKTSIDELPQLFNVLKGEMSLVGPRPPLPDEVNRYEWLFRRRLSVKPGITCVWQISGRSTTTFDEWMKMDKHYVENWSLWLDIKILLKTIPAVLFCRGAS